MLQHQIKHPLPPMPEGYPISVKVIEDSAKVDSTGAPFNRITTVEAVFPRYILAELATHRVLSKNASSSRAIPTKKAVTAAQDIVYPVRWGMNQPGMQPSLENLKGDALLKAEAIWANTAAVCMQASLALADLGLHKQWASRPLEWFSTIRLAITTTELDNMFNLRDHPAAQDEIHYLMHEWKRALNSSVPNILRGDEWHIPYVTEEERGTLGLENSLKVSAARCARTSYKTVHGVTSTLEDDLALFERLKAGVGVNEDDPFHASPTEHQARPAGYWEDTPDFTGNFRGWVQYRKVVEGNAHLEM